MDENVSASQLEQASGRRQSTAGQERFVIEGLLTGLQVAERKHRLLVQIDDYCQATSPDAGAVVDARYRQAAQRAVAVLSDGEDLEHFMCMIGAQFVGGSFGGASKLTTGARVRAVVHQRGDMLIAEAILSDSEGLVWVRHARGYQAELKAIFKLAAGLFCFSMIGIALCIIFIGVNFEWSKLETMAWGAVVTGALCFGMALWDGSMINRAADPATQVFRLLGFANPESVNLSNYRYGLVYGHRLLHTTETNANHVDICCYQNAVADRKVRMASQSPAP